MLFKYLTSPERFDAAPDVLLPGWPTTATPPTFAPPAGMHEDESAYTLFFNVGTRPATTLEVTVAGRMLFVLGEALGAPKYPRAIRAFLLRSPVDVLGMSTRLEEPMLIVRLPKTAAGRRTIVVQRGG